MRTLSHVPVVYYIAFIAELTLSQVYPTEMSTVEE